MCGVKTRVERSKGGGGESWGNGPGMTNKATSACAAPDIMFGMKSRWPGASNTVKWRRSVFNVRSARSIVTPCSRSDWLSSITHASANDPFPCSLASFSYLWIVR